MKRTMEMMMKKRMKKNKRMDSNRMAAVAASTAPHGISGARRSTSTSARPTGARRIGTGGKKNALECVKKNRKGKEFHPFLFFSEGGVEDECGSICDS
jgi:hypothetical protein